MEYSPWESSHWVFLHWSCPPVFCAIPCAGSQITLLLALPSALPPLWRCRQSTLVSLRCCVRKAASMDPQALAHWGQVPGSQYSRAWTHLESCGSSLDLSPPSASMHPQRVYLLLSDSSSRGNTHCPTPKAVSRKRLLWWTPRLPSHAPSQWCFASMVGPGFFLLYSQLRPYHTPAASGCLSAADSVLSLGLSSETQVSALSSCPHQWMHILGWGLQQRSRDPLCSACCQSAAGCMLFSVSIAPLLFQLISPLVKGLPRVLELCFFSCFLPGAQVPPPFLFCFFLLSYPVMWRSFLHCHLISLPVFSKVFCENFSTCRYTFESY